MTYHVPENYMEITHSFYEKNADEYVSNTGSMEDLSWLENFSTFLPERACVLDAGCAAGRDTEWFANKGYDTYGIDFSERMIEKAKQAVKNAKFIKMNLMNLDFSDAFFDGIWASCVLLHISKADIPKVINNFSRVLKKGGVVYIQVKTGLIEGIEKDSRYDGDEKFASYFESDELTHLLIKSGFNISESTKFNDKVDNYRATNRVLLIAQKVH